LNRRYISKKPEFIIVYGRRRVGKTGLVAQFIKNKPAIFFLAEEKKDMENLKDMQIEMKNFLNDSEFGLINFSDWYELFGGFIKRTKRRCIIVIDEFPHLVEQNSSVPSQFQKIWDMNLGKSNVVLILIGSSTGMMEKLPGSKSPLYGRRTGQLEVKPIPLAEINRFFPKYDMQDIIRVYGCTDSIPLYLVQFSANDSFYNNLKNNFLYRDRMLYNEAEILLKQEFRESANYFSILKAIAFGYTKNNEIADYADIEKSIVSKYLQNLGQIRIIKKEYPVTERKEKIKSARYVFTDNYFRFWFRFIYPNRTLIEKGEARAVEEIIKKDYNSYLGIVFEKVSEEFLWKVKPIKPTKLGRWWHKDKEIDVVALNEQTRDILFAECKWQDGVNAEKILAELKEKAKYVEWINDKRKEHYTVFAKSFNKRIKEQEGAKVYCYDLSDMEKVLRKN